MEEGKKGFVLYRCHCGALILPKEGKVEDGRGGHFHLGCFQVMMSVVGSFNERTAGEFFRVADYIRDRWDEVEVACRGDAALLDHASNVKLYLETGTVVLRGVDGVDREVEVVP